jgi:hypothetical protein
MPIAFPLGQYRSPVFVETGTYLGDGVWLALKAGFRKIYSIEISPEYHAAACRRFASEIATKRVELMLGDSLDLVGEVISREAREMTFWLDAHSMPHNLSAENEGLESGAHCPLYEELDAIAAHPLKSHTIMIDDVRLMGNVSAWGGHGVDLQGIEKRILAINPAYRIIFEKGFQKDDVLVAYTRRSHLRKWIEQGQLPLRRVYRKLRF